MDALKYVNSENLAYVTHGLTFDVKQFARVLDSALIEANAQTGIVDKVVEWNQQGGLCRESLSFPELGQLIVDATALIKSDGSMVHIAEAKLDQKQKERAPALHINMHSPSLNVPMRTEIPLRAIVKGDQPITGTYCIYLHVLIDDAGQEFVYYGMTKRAWNARFHEHTELAFKHKSKRLFPNKLNQLVEARTDELYGLRRQGETLDLSAFVQSSNARKLAGLITALCVVGLDRDAAMDSEEYLVDKYSLSSKHRNGLNMLPGGYEGLRALHRMSIRTSQKNLETHDREELLENYLRKNPHLGVPKPGIAEKWNDPTYAEAVICGRENRLTGDQVRQIRYLAANGQTPELIQSQLSAVDVAQVNRVIQGRTYSRIK